MSLTDKLAIFLPKTPQEKEILKVLSDIKKSGAGLGKIILTTKANNLNEAYGKNSRLYAYFSEKIKKY
jgi:hypothetical protein